MLTAPRLETPLSRVESIERATLAAVCPSCVEELPGWLLGLDSGTVGRAHSAAPLQHTALDVEVLTTLEARYAGHQLPVVLRLPRVDSFEPLRRRLVQGHYAPSQPTQVQISRTQQMAQALSGDGVELTTAPDDAWSAVFLGEGFDPVDGAHRVKLLSRAKDAVFASVRVNNAVVAVGVACFSHGWASVHGMRTALANRGQGMAGRILGAFAKEALGRQVEDVFLQVHADNASAQSLYRRAGFTTAWTYEYWRQPKP